MNKIYYLLPFWLLKIINIALLLHLAKTKATDKKENNKNEDNKNA